MKTLRRALKWLWWLGAPAGVREAHDEPVPPGRNSLDYLYPSRAEIEAAWERGDAPAYGGCQSCEAVRPLELDGTCCGCGALSGLAPQFHRKVDGRWKRVEATQ